MTEKCLVEVRYTRGQNRGGRIIPKKDIYFDTLLEISIKEDSDLNYEVYEMINKINGYCTYVIAVNVLKKEKVA